MRISKKSLLVELLSGVQVVCLTVALVGGALWVRSSVYDIVRSQIKDDNTLIATQMSKIIGQRQDIKDVQFGNAGWDKLQALVEEVKLPNKGYICVADRNGFLLCHPEMRANPALRQVDVLNARIAIEDAERISIRDSLTDTDTTVTGVIGAGNTTEVVSVAAIPHLESSLLVHQSESGFRKAASLVLLPIGGISLIVGLLLIVVTKKASVGILNRYENKIAEINEGLEETVRQRTRALTKTRDAVIFGLAKLSESRDNDTGQHLERISTYVNILSKHLASIRPVEKQIIDHIGLASSLHDIGKVGVPDQILLKPGRFDAEERKAIEVHPKIGQECLEAIEAELGDDNFLSLAREICAYHHEKWDGTGYPYGLAGEDIPVSARIVAVADVYDALRSRRPYKDPMPHQKARSIILEGSGSHFDPAVVSAFLKGEAEFEQFSQSKVEEPENNGTQHVALMPQGSSQTLVGATLQSN